MNILKKVSILFVLSLVIQVCTVQKNDSNNAVSIKGTFENFDVKYNQHQINAEDGQELRFENGTVIKIPANAFVDKKGNTVKGKVDIDYREFHTVSEIMTSGIPMQYDDGKEQYDFESAGMLEIRGKQNGEEIYVAKDKTIAINMASHKDGEFNLYEFEEAVAETTTSYNAVFTTSAYAQAVSNDRQAGKWKILAKNQKADPNVDKKKLEDEIAEEANELTQEPEEPKAANQNTYMFDFDVDVTEFPELRQFEGSLWEYGGEDASKDPEKNEWIFDTEWNNVSLQAYDPSNLKYKLILTGNGKNFETIIRPGRTQGNMAKYKQVYKQKMAQYKAVEEKEKEKRKKLADKKRQAAQVANFRRAFSIQSFGVYNCDRPVNNDNYVMIAADFKISNDPNAPKAEMTVFLITENDAAVIEYDPARWKRFAISKNKKNKIVAVINGKKVAVLGYDDLKALDIKDLKKNKKHTFVLKGLEKEIKSVKELNEVILSLG